jgi:hypothetical protein
MKIARNAIFDRKEVDGAIECIAATALLDILEKPARLLKTGDTRW